jgi:hypothetical protein
MRSAALAGSGAISGVLTTSGCCSLGAGVRRNMPPSAMAFANAENVAYPRSKSPSMLPSKM